MIRGEPHIDLYKSVANSAAFHLPSSFFFSISTIRVRILT